MTTPLIIGAGPGGLAAALFLAKAGVASTVLDRDTYPRDKVCGDALSGKVVEVLNKLDPTIVPNFYQKSQLQLGSWGVRFVAPNLHDIRIPFKSNTKPSQPLPPGYISRRLDFDYYLYQLAKAQPLITLYEAAQVKQLARNSEGIVATLADGRTFGSSLVLGADGAQGISARQLAGQQLQPRHYCAGIRAYYQGVQGLDSENFIELHFLRSLLPGYLWVFPLPGGAAIVGVGIRSDVVSKKKLNLKLLLQHELQHNPELKARFAGASLEGPVQGFGLPLGSRRVPLSGDNFMLLGDAGSLIDPFTGEGIGNALACGLLAAQQVVLAQQTSDYSAAALRPYDDAVWQRLGSELRLSSIMQRLVHYPWLFNFVVNKAKRSKTLQETISCMFDDIDLRARLRNPLFYLRLLWG